MTNYIKYSTVTYYAPDTINKKKAIALQPCPMCGEAPKLAMRKSRSKTYDGYVGRLRCSCGMQTVPVRSYKKDSLAEKLEMIWNMDPDLYQELPFKGIWA